jgi:hypothetical protein
MPPLIMLVLKVITPACRVRLARGRYIHYMPTISMAPQKESSPYTVFSMSITHVEYRTHISLREVEISDRQIRALDEDREVAPRASRQVLDLSSKPSVSGAAYPPSLGAHTSQFPPCSRPGIVLAPSSAIFCRTAGSSSCPT